MFPANEFESIQAELISHTVAPSPRLNRYRSAGSKEPYYQFSLQTQMKNYRDFSRIDAALDSYQGELAVFKLRNPMVSHKTHASISLYQPVARGERVITLAGFGTNEVDAACAGDFIQISGSTKAYRIAVDSNANASGHAQVTLTQAAIQDYASLSAVPYGDDVEFQVSMKERDSDATQADKGKWGSHYVELIEQL